MRGCLPFLYSLETTGCPPGEYKQGEGAAATCIKYEPGFWCASETQCTSPPDPCGPAEVTPRISQPLGPLSALRCACCGAVAGGRRATAAYTVCRFHLDASAANAWRLPQPPSPSQYFCRGYVGLGLRENVLEGWFSTGGGPDLSDTEGPGRTGQQRCIVGHKCPVGGKAIPCETGKFRWVEWRRWWCVGAGSAYGQEQECGGYSCLKNGAERCCFVDHFSRMTGGLTFGNPYAPVQQRRRSYCLQPSRCRSLCKRKRPHTSSAV